VSPHSSSRRRAGACPAHVRRLAGGGLGRWRTRWRALRKPSRPAAGLKASCRRCSDHWAWRCWSSPHCAASPLGGS